MILVIDGIFYYPTSHQAFIMWSHVGGRALFREEPLEEGMAAHSSILAWRIPWIGEPGRLHSEAT